MCSIWSCQNFSPFKSSIKASAERHSKSAAGARHTEADFEQWRTVRIDKCHRTSEPRRTATALPLASVVIPSCGNMLYVIRHILSVYLVIWFQNISVCRYIVNQALVTCQSESELVGSPHFGDETGVRQYKGRVAAIGRAARAFFWYQWNQFSWKKTSCTPSSNWLCHFKVHRNLTCPVKYPTWILQLWRLSLTISVLLPQRLFSASNLTVGHGSLNSQCWVM